MAIDPFSRLKDEACAEAYDYFDRHIRRLPRDKVGKIDINSPELNDNDIDAFRHAYVSGVFTQGFGDRAANWFGLRVEYSPEGQYSHSLDPRSRNMDLCNNRVGRRYGRKTGGRKTLLKLIHGALSEAS